MRTFTPYLPIIYSYIYLSVYFIFRAIFIVQTTQKELGKVGQDKTPISRSGCNGSERGTTPIKPLSN